MARPRRTTVQRSPRCSTASNLCMPRTALPPTAATVSFIDCINRGDLAALSQLMHDDHELVVLHEAPLAGKAANVDAWAGYFAAYPTYVIYPGHIVACDDRVAVFGTTTGSHLGLSDEAELQLHVAWIADVEGGLRSWTVAEDSASLRCEFGVSGDKVPSSGG